MAEYRYPPVLVIDTVTEAPLRNKAVTFHDAAGAAATAYDIDGLATTLSTNGHGVVPEWWADVASGELRADGVSIGVLSPKGFATKVELAEAVTGDPVAVTDLTMSAVVTDPASDTSAALGTRYALKGEGTIPGNRVIIFGDSLTAQNGSGPSALDVTGGPAQDGRGYFNWANGYLGQRATLVRNAGVGGDTTALMLTRVAADVLAYDSEWVWVCGGANDIANGRIAADIVTDMGAILDALAADGRKVLVITPPPSDNYTASELVVAGEVLDWFRALPDTRPGTTLVDTWRMLADPADGYPATGMTHDGIHWSPAGAMRLGKAVADAVAPLMPYRPNKVITLGHPDNVHGNPHMAGPGTGWAALGGGVSVAYEADPDRWAQRAILTITGVADSAERGITYTEPVGNGRYAAGDIVQASARISWENLVPTSVATGSFLPWLRIYPRLADNSFTTPALALTTASATSALPVGVPSSGEVVVLTSRLTLPATVANLYLGFGVQGIASGTIRVSDVAVWKNA